MTPELQSVVDRLETVERQARGWKVLVAVAILLAAAAIAVPIAMPRPAPAPAVAVRAADPERARYEVVEANRFILRDRKGAVAGGMEVTADGTIKLVLGNAQGKTGAAFLEVEPAGGAHLALRGAAAGARPGATILTRPDGAGAIQLANAAGRTSFRRP